MYYLVIQILKFVNDDQPGWVACQLLDAHDHHHLFIEKAPVVCTDDLDANSHYPRPGVIACEILERYSDHEGRELVRVNTELPWGIESSDGINEFVVIDEQLVYADD